MSASARETADWIRVVVARVFGSSCARRRRSASVAIAIALSGLRRSWLTMPMSCRSSSARPRSSVTSRPTAAKTSAPGSARGVEAHPAHLPVPADHPAGEAGRRAAPRAFARPGRRVAPRSSGWTSSRYGRASSSASEYPSTAPNAGFTRRKCPSRPTTARRSGEIAKNRSSSRSRSCSALLGLARPRLGPLALGDVAQEDGDPALVGGVRRHLRPHPERPEVLLEPDGDAVPHAAGELAQVAGRRLARLRPHLPEHAAEETRRAASSPRAPRARVDEDDAPARVEQQERVAVLERVERALALADRGAGADLRRALDGAGDHLVDGAVEGALRRRAPSGRPSASERAPALERGRPEERQLARGGARVERVDGLERQEEREIARGDPRAPPSSAIRTASARRSRSAGSFGRRAAARQRRCRGSGGAPPPRRRGSRPLARPGSRTSRGRTRSTPLDGIRNNLLRSDRACRSPPKPHKMRRARSARTAPFGEACDEAATSRASRPRR